MSRNGRVLVAMSGGVDSSVAAALLHADGYEVVGVTMKTWDYETSLGGSGMGRKASGCCSLDDMNDARAIAVSLGFAHTVIDIRAAFGTWVIDRFETDYLSGRTPNPCVLCNTHIKWAELLRRADALGCEHISTGHYAQVRREGGRSIVSRGLDLNKDQSYALWGVSQDHLARTLFPLGGMTKPEIRAIAADMGFDHVATKPDSYEICFVPDDDYRGFLRRRVDGLEERVSGGLFVHAETGETLGSHEGYPFYTVGQRRGLGLSDANPLYVTRIDPATNTVFVGPREALLGHTLRAEDVVWGKESGFSEERTLLARIRYKDPGAEALVTQTGTGFDAIFEEPRAAIAPGQAVVLYDGDDVVAGGWIAVPDDTGLSFELPVMQRAVAGVSA